MLSIIIPVYNVEPYLKRCLESVLLLPQNQIEVVLVDDGSTDKSGDICDDYGKAYNWIVIHKQNGGLSDARNVGLECASGDYVWFVDSDDFISDSFSAISDLIVKTCPEIIVMDYEVYQNDSITTKRRVFIEENRIYNGTEFLTEALRSREYFVPVWSHIYSRKFLIDNSFRFRKGIYHEDEQLVPYMFLAANRIVCIKEAPYKYMIRSNSIAHSNKWEKNVIDSYDIFKENATYYRNHLKSEELKNLLLIDIVEKMIYIICKYNVNNIAAKKYVDYNFLKNNAMNLKTKIRIYIFIYLRKVYNMLWRINERTK